MNDPSPMKVAVFNDTRSDNHYGCELVMRELIQLLHTNDLRPFFFWPVNKDWDSQLVKARFAEADAIIVNGEGTIHGDRPRTHYLANLGHYARSHKKPAFLVNALIHDISDEVAAKLRTFTRIFVRDSNSSGELARFGIDSTVVPDLSFNASFPEFSQRRGVCGLDCNVTAVSNQIRAYCRLHGYPFYRMRLSFRRNPLEYLRYKINPTSQPERMAATIGRYEMAITGRFHGVVYCLLTGTPFIAIQANSPKLASLLKDVFGNTVRLRRMESLSSSDLSVLARWSDEEVLQIDQFRSKARIGIKKMIQTIAEDVRAGILQSRSIGR